MRALFKIACKAALEVYKDHIDLGTTEYKFTTTKLGPDKIHVLAFAGSNEKKDWIKNFTLTSKKGIKKVAVEAAKEVHEQIKDKIKYPILVTGHSKAGPECIAYKKLFDAKYCVAFSPARSLRYWSNRNMTKTWLFIDPDDPVSKAGFISFGHPICITINGKNDPEFLKSSDHDMNIWTEFIKNM